MKTKILFGIFLSLSTITMAQENIETTNTDGIQKFECDKLVLISENNTILYLGNVHCKTEKLEIVKADKVQLDKKTNTITVYNAQSFTFEGTIHISNPKKQKKTIVYTIGEDFAFIR